jgi:CubicO group peptidase (beta-lactamase class C family)
VANVSPCVERLLRDCAAVFVACTSLSAQEPAPPWAAEVDALFAQGDKPGSPGCALGVIQDGVLVHARGFGLASLEHAVPITRETVFDIGSTSKQFTAACIGLLVQENKLGVEDDVRAWLPELQDFGVTVTLDHMLHHTSGLPDYLGLLAADGAKDEDWTTAEDALEKLAGVPKLEFLPGSKFAYSNSNFFLLSLVVERASEKTLAQFAAERIFAPLGMKSTLVLDDHTLVIPKRATAYLPRKGGGFRVCMSDFEQTGDGAVQTTLEDLARWDANFYSHQVGGAALQSFLHATGKLNDGSAIKYARGLFVDSFRGLPRVSHGGSWAGYRAELMRFPEQKTSILLLCNLGIMNPTALCEQVAGLVLGGRMDAK